MKKLKSSLYAVLNSQNVDSPDYRIAKYMIQNLHCVDKMPLKEVADRCFVSKATVSRFCRKIGYEDYQAMNQDIHRTMMRMYQRCDEYINAGNEQVTHEYIDDLKQSICDVENNISQLMIQSLVQDLFNYHNIGVFGRMHSYAVALNFQCELGSCGKYVNAFSSISEQEEYILNADENTMVLIISSSGRYFEDFSKYMDFESKKKPYFVLITNNNRLRGLNPYNKVYVIPSKSNTASQPFSLMLFTNLVAAHYTKYLHDKRKK